MRVAFSTFGRAIGVWVIAGAAVGYGIIPLWAGVLLVILGPIGGYFRARYVARQRDADAYERHTAAIAEGIRRSRDVPCAGDSSRETERRPQEYDIMSRPIGR